MAAVASDWRDAELGEADRALCAYAEKLTREPARMTEGDVRALREAGAVQALITGSGPTAFGLFADIAKADAGAAALPPRYANAIVTAPARTMGGGG